MRHFYLRDATGFPVACIASHIERTLPTLVVQYTVSIWHPGDRFNRKLGREIARRRLEKHSKQVITVHWQDSLVPVKHGILEDICLRQFDGKEGFPRRIVEAAAHWLDTHPIVDPKLKKMFEGLTEIIAQAMLQPGAVEDCLTITFADNPDDQGTREAGGV